MKDWSENTTSLQAMLYAIRNALTNQKPSNKRSEAIRLMVDVMRTDLDEIEKKNDD